MNLRSITLSALASALILGVPINTFADDEKDRYERYNFYDFRSDNVYDEDEEDERDERDEEEDERDHEDEEDEKSGEDDNSGNTITIVLPSSYTPNVGRLLGAQCAQCHGTNGVSTNSWDSIAGEGDLEDEIYEDDEPIMMAQAHGYTSEEIILIGEWLRTLKEND